MSSNNAVIKNSNISVEMIEKIKKMRLILKKEKSIVKPEPDDGDSSDSDDSWLDDEQWYCEKMAQWSGRVKVTPSIQENPKKLKDFLQTRFRSKSC
jgi:hypothetical protein